MIYNIPLFKAFSWLESLVIACITPTLKFELTCIMDYNVFGGGGVQQRVLQDGS